MTQPTIPVTDPEAAAALRSGLYGLLALGFKYPTRETFAALKEGGFLAELEEVASRLPHLDPVVAELAPRARKAAKDLQGASFAGFEVSYVSTFDAGFPQPPCPPYEGVYVEEERSKLMIEVSEFYRTFGLAMSQAEDRRELPDYLPAELEFLHFLAFKEAQARHEGDPELLEGYVHAQKDFLERHLARWLPAFAEKLSRQRDVAFFPELAAVAAALVAAELEHVAAVHARLAAARPPAPPPAEPAAEPLRAEA